MGGENFAYGFQGAVGTFKNLQNRKVLELYGGFGYESFNDKNQDTYKHYGRCQIYYAQLNYGKINGNFDHIDYGWGLKAGYIHANEVNWEYRDHNGGILVEPMFFVRFGGEKLKVQTVIGACHVFNKDFDNLPINFGLGVSYGF